MRLTPYQSEHIRNNQIGHMTDMRMLRSLMFKLDKPPIIAICAATPAAFFWGRNALLQQDEEGSFRARPAADLRIVFNSLYGDEADWDSSIRSVGLVAKALNKGDMARATMTAVLMRLPDPDGPIGFAGLSGGLAKAGFNPDEPRDERGRWTYGGNNGNDDAEPSGHNARIQLADAGCTDLVLARKAAEEDLLKRRRLTNILFAAAVERRLAGDESGCHMYMAECASLTTPLIEYEWHLARSEILARRSI